jgi:hypothetical protein
MSEQGKASELHGIRAWYERSTKRARRALVWATLIMAIGMFVFWTGVPAHWAARLQTANGAYTIPAFGGLWIAAFMFIWLIPMRELSFRGQESMERTEERLKVSLAKWDEIVDQKILPAVATWQRIGTAIETEVLPHAKETLLEIERAALVVTEKAGLIEKRAHDIQSKAEPGIESVKRIAGQFERHIVSGMLEKMQTVLEAMATMNGLTFGKKGSKPDLGRALANVQKKKADLPPLPEPEPQPAPADEPSRTPERSVS